MRSSGPPNGWSSMTRRSRRLLGLAGALIALWQPVDLAAQQMPAPANDPSALSSATPLPALQSLADSGDAAAQFELGSRHLYGNQVPQDNFAAAGWFRKAAAQNNRDAQYNLGVMALNGIGAIADVDEALRWFHLAAENADPTAQFTLGVFYANGRGVAQDIAKAHMWFSLAAAGGDRSAGVNAVLLQEMLSLEQLEESQAAAQAWIGKFNAAE